MDEDTKKGLIVATIKAEKHLGENLKKILIDYVNNLKEE